MDYKLEFFEYIKRYRVISIIGMAKNVGKTTTLNHIIKQSRNKYTLGLTSIGRDGEIIDIISCKKKPDIYVQKGTIIATAKDCFGSCDFTKEIISTTGINTPMGEIVILKALSDGYVELGGPSIGTQLKNLILTLKELGSEIILIDGAFDRKFFASPSISEATILVTGAAFSKDINEIIEETNHTIDLLNIARVEDEKLLKILKKLSHVKLCIFDDDYNYNVIDVITSLDAAQKIADNIEDKTRYVYIKGVLTDKLIKDLMKITDNYKDIIFVVENGTKLFLSKKIFKMFVKRGGNIRTVEAINIICVVANPYSLSDDYLFDESKFLSLLRKKQRKNYKS
ncbi:MAG: hypothetical protein P8Y70_04245 [Candidatus Lokiarchaeota archaeon]